RHSAESFLTVNRIEEPATQGWRGALNHIGLHLAPSTSERAERDDVQAVSQHWPGPRTIVIVNQKGGANKTPTAILLAAVFAQFGGAGVNAWDTNQLQGTLGWRTEQGPHEATAADLLAHAAQLLGTEAQSADLARFVHHQTADKYDVLRAQPLLRDATRRLTPDQITLIHQVLGKYYRVVVADTSNDPSDPAWLQLMSHADQLVVATTTSDDRAEAGRLLLDDLESSGGHEAELAAGAVTVVSQADQKAPKSDLKRIAAGYRELTRAVVQIPYDPAMVSGWLRWGALAGQTRRAWLAAGAAVAAGL
ncbi:MAG: ATPase, partial [Acidipropionibacterium jensenii]|uniref:ATPase n=2 Tax=Acidipropionibacterium jensenii TaxID=1749 RepID=UPI00264703A6